MAARILVVEDNPDNMSLMVYLLRARRVRASAGLGGAEGVRAAAEALPDLILMDLLMPGDGRIRGDRPDQEPPRAREGASVVAVTASAMVGDRERIAAAGFDGYICEADRRRDAS